MTGKINLDNPIFGRMKIDFEKVMTELIKTMIDREKSSAEITIRFSVDMTKQYINSEQKITFTRIDHRINSVLKNEYRINGTSGNGYVINKNKNKEYTITRFRDNQISFDDSNY